MPNANFLSLLLVAFVFYFSYGFSFFRLHHLQVIVICD